MTLLGLGAVEHLYKLLSHEDPLVRRNAVMVFGIMASNRKSLKVLLFFSVWSSEQQVDRVKKFYINGPE